MNIIRVFPTRTSLTPIDEYAFVGDPPMIRPEADEVHVSCTFTWDILKAKRLVEAWRQYYPTVKLGGPSIAPISAEFQPGMYIMEGVTFTSRGCNNCCPWCLVPEREGRLTELPIVPGHIIQDNNFLQCSAEHRQKVYRMLDKQRKAAIFTGGLQASLITDAIAEELASIRIREVFLAADNTNSLVPLRVAVRRLSFLSQRKLRCYMMIGYGNETLQEAERRLQEAWSIGVLPFAQLYQPADRWIDYDPKWKALSKAWSRPAAMFAMHKVLKHGK